MVGYGQWIFCPRLWVHLLPGNEQHGTQNCARRIIPGYYIQFVNESVTFFSSRFDERSATLWLCSVSDRFEVLVQEEVTLEGHATASLAHVGESVFRSVRLFSGDVGHRIECRLAETIHCRSLHNTTINPRQCASGVFGIDWYWRERTRCGLDAKLFAIQ